MVQRAPFADASSQTLARRMRLPGSSLGVLPPSRSSQMKHFAINYKHTYYASSDCTRQQTEKTANHPPLDCHAPRGVQTILPFGRGGERKGGKASEEEHRERKSGESLTSPPPRPDLSFSSVLLSSFYARGCPVQKLMRSRASNLCLNALRVFDLNL